MFSEGRSIWCLSSVSSRKLYPYTMLSRPLHVIYFIIWRLNSLQSGCRLALRTPFLSSQNCSFSRKNSFLAFWHSFLSSLSQGTPIGRSVTLLMNCGVSLRFKPLKLTLASVLILASKLAGIPLPPRHHNLEVCRRTTSIVHEKTGLPPQGFPVASLSMLVLS